MGLKLEYKSLECKVEDLDKGTVKFVASVADNVDSGDDLINGSKAWLKTVNSKEDQQRLRHFREHDTRRWVGFPTLSIDGSKLWATSKLMLKRDDGLDTYELYKAAAEAERMVEHSIGYNAEDYSYKEINGVQVRLIDEMMIGEVTTLSSWGMNKEASEFSVKSLDMNALIIEDAFFSKLLNAKFSDVKLEGIQKLKDKIEAEIKARQPKTIYDYL